VKLRDLLEQLPVPLTFADAGSVREECPKRRCAVGACADRQLLHERADAAVGLALSDTGGKDIQSDEQFSCLVEARSRLRLDPEGAEVLTRSPHPASSPTH
jgi:hypothetical protein